MQLEDWRRAGQSFRHKGHQVFFHEEGPAAAEALVCIHGFPTASWDWHRLWPELTRRFRVLAIDMLGFGFSDKPRRYEYTTFDQADLHEELLAERGIRSTHLLAHDYGDTVAQELLARFEERLAAGTPGLELRSVCLLNGGLFPETHRIRLVQELLKSPLGFLVGRLMSERRFGKSLGAVFGPNTRPSKAELREFWQLVNFNRGPLVAHKLIRYVAERKRHRARWVGVLERTGVPLRLIDGPEDPVSGRHMGERYRQLVPRPDVVFLGGIGHYPQLEDPPGTLRAFLEFVARPASGRTTRAAASGVSGHAQHAPKEYPKRASDSDPQPHA
jgi:pimeloyl-ACP methyl ester carboxylesterase